MPIDTSKPSVSRIYDFILGGEHNFEVDRMAAQQILKMTPSYTTWARLNRWFLQMVASQWADGGHAHILDLGSGMPTQGHFHSSAPQAKVVYSDIDPMTVAYAREVIGDNPAVAYIQTDIREPDELLAAADQLFDGQRRVAIGFIGLSYFMDDASLAKVAQALHDWSAPGSVMALSYGHVQATVESREKLENFKRNSAQVYIRDEAEVRALMAPWRVSSLRPLAEWLGVEQLVQDTDREGIGAEMYGVLLEHAG